LIKGKNNFDEMMKYMGNDHNLLYNEIKETRPYAERFNEVRKFRNKICHSITVRALPYLNMKEECLVSWLNNQLLEDIPRTRFIRESDLQMEYLTTDVLKLYLDKLKALQNEITMI
jgi:hypothetical protein